jgi:hypothetical protein
MRCTKKQKSRKPTATKTATSEIRRLFADLVAVLSFFEPPEWLLSGCLVAVVPFKPHNINDLTNALFRVQNGYDRESNALSSKFSA